MKSAYIHTYDCINNNIKLSGLVLYEYRHFGPAVNSPRRVDRVLF